MLIRERLETFSFTAGEQKVVDYLLVEGDNIADKSTSQIALATFSSKSTLVRIAQKLNYSGWSDFKADYLREIDYLDKFVAKVDANRPFTKNDSLMSIAAKIAALEEEAIADSLSLLSHNQLRQALTLLTDAKTIHLFAVSNNLLLAQEFAHNMARIKKDVRIHALQSELIFQAGLAEADSCAIIISYSGETEVLKDVSQLLKQKQIPIILLTSLGENSLSRVADCLLHLSTQEKLYSKIASFATDYSITYILDVLYSCVFAQNYNENFKLKQTLAAQVEKHRSSDSAILREE
ncbi:MurR/RpiR family transcriptional regulator [Enterococcus sp. LJL90]